MTAPADELTLRSATMDDLPVLTVLNLQLIEDQRHDNPAGPDDVEQRMRRWLDGSYQVRLIEFADTVVAYAVWRADADGVYLRQFFVACDKRRSAWVAERLRCSASNGKTKRYAWTFCCTTSRPWPSTAPSDFRTTPLVCAAIHNLRQGPEPVVR